MSMIVIYPSDPLIPKKQAVDGLWIEEANALASVGFEIVPVDVDNLNTRQLEKLTGRSILYRGWMLTPQKYETLESELKKHNASLLCNTHDYTATHYLPNWYPKVKDYTAETIIVENPYQLKEAITSLKWKEGYFLKDFVKSLKTSTGSTVMNYAEAENVLREMAHYRGTIEGGICIRRHLNLQNNTEVRFFALNGRVCSPDGCIIPPMVQEIADRFKDIFISIDIAKLENGDYTLIEIGNGQVSDHVGWELSKFADTLYQLYKHELTAEYGYN